MSHIVLRHVKKVPSDPLTMDMFLAKIGAFYENIWSIFTQIGIFELKWYMGLKWNWNISTEIGALW